MDILPVILSGGSGTRLWPLSRLRFPKQLQVLCGKEAMLVQAATHLTRGGEIMAPTIICGADQSFLVADQLRHSNIDPSAIILEPVPRGTAPALVIAALSAPTPETILVALPADQFISDSEAFTRDVRRAALLARNGRLMTLGIKPASPHTGYGYIEVGAALPESSEAHLIASFKEKPDLEMAAAYLKSGNFLWNAGIFVFRADVFLAEIEKRHPEIIACCRRAWEKRLLEGAFTSIDPEEFSKSLSISVDYALMEHIVGAGVLPVEFGWSDIGNWKSLWAAGERDEKGNTAVGDVILHDVKNCYIRSESRLVAAIGIENIAVVETQDALLVTALEKAEDVKAIVSELKLKKRSEEFSHHRSHHKWGYYEKLNEDRGITVALRMIKPGASWQTPDSEDRDLHLTILEGKAQILDGLASSIFGAGEFFPLKKGRIVVVRNCGPGLLRLLDTRLPTLPKKCD